MVSQLLLRADASFNIGTGHIMRLIALVDAWCNLTQFKKVTLLGAVTIPALRQRLSQYNIELQEIVACHPDPQDCNDLAKWARQLQPAWIVLDGYHFDSSYQSAIYSLGFPLLVIDDCAYYRNYYADLLLNYQPDATTLPYQVADNTRLLFGSSFFLLRPELRAARPDNLLSVTVPRRKLLITMGGSDPQGLTFFALQALIILGSSWEAKIVLGSALQNDTELRRMAAIYPNIEIISAVENMAPLMLWADFALAAAGTTTWELAFFGVPALVIATVDNQIRVAAVAHTAGCAINLGWWEELTLPQLVNELHALAENPQQRNVMRYAGRCLIDGDGAARVARIMWEDSRMNKK